MQLLASLERLSKEEPDEDLRQLAYEDISSAKDSLTTLTESLRLQLLTTSKHDTYNTILEISMGIGGSEGAIFAQDLTEMYYSYAKRNFTDVSLIDIQSSNVGGYAKAILQIEGENAFGKLKREAGVHRVQRVPTTETQGRVHTSTAAVIVRGSSVGISKRLLM